MTKGAFGIGGLIVAGLILYAITRPKSIPPGMAILEGEITNTATNRPIADVLVRIEQAGTPTYRYYTDSNGRYRTVFALEPGWYDIAFEKDGFSGWYVYHFLKVGINKMDLGLAPI